LLSYTGLKRDDADVLNLNIRFLFANYCKNNFYIDKIPILREIIIYYSVVMALFLLWGVGFRTANVGF